MLNGQRLRVKPRFTLLRVAANSLGIFTRSSRRCLAPQLLQPVELARLGCEYVNDHIEIIHQDPPRLPRSLDHAGQRLMLTLQSLEDAIVNRLGLTARVPRADDEEVGV